MVLMWFWICGWFLVVLIVIGNGLVIYLVVIRFCFYIIVNWFILFLVVVDLCCGLLFFFLMFGVMLGFYMIDFIYVGVYFKVSFIFFYCLNVSVCVMIVDCFIVIIKFFRYVFLMMVEIIRILIFVVWIVLFVFFGFFFIFMYRGNLGYIMFMEIFRVIIF